MNTPRSVGTSASRDQATDSPPGLSTDQPLDRLVKKGTLANPAFLNTTRNPAARNRPSGVGAKEGDIG